jgi:glycosyltransferase involved in cell wall biosynthesis
MKILVLSFYYHPDLCAGSFRTTALVAELKNKDDVKVHVVTTMPNRYSSYEAKSSFLEKNDNVTINRIELPSHNSGMLDQIKSFFTYYRKVNKLLKNNDFDLVYATSSRLFTAFLGARISKKKNIPLYLDIRDIFVDTIKDVLNPYMSKLLKPILIQVEKYTFSRARHINLVSKGFHDYFTNRFNRPTYTYFTNGIDNEFLSIPKVVRRRVDDKKQILYAGNIGEGQGLHFIIPKLAKHIEGNYEILVVGDGGRKSILKEYIHECSNVTLKEPVNRDELIQLYMNADVLFIHLNDYPAFEKVLPSKIFEYAATGKPILAGVRGFAREFLSEEVDNVQVFDPGDDEAAVSALQKIYFDVVDRSIFINKFTRESLMKKMADSLITTSNQSG